jgi:hypothetical protein
MVVNSGSPDVGGGGLKGEVLLAGDMGKHPKGLGHDLRAYIITSEYGELEGLHGKEVNR